MSDDSDFEKCTFQEDQNSYVNTEPQSFDVCAGQTWIYPINYPIREYQFNIIQNALFQNTLVSLPTGLGKTFIAAVVMYNFYRWYPTGKILFLAPTRPLVRQQMDACYNVTAIPPEVTAELTGTKEKKSRADIWKTKRVFFITPQIFQNDIETVNDLGSSVRCIVFDEAHRTRGNHAYSEVMRKLTQQNNSFRVLALSATPGRDINDMKEVIQNLLISHLEFRTEESKDVQPYVYQRSLETVVVPLDDRMQHIKSAYLEILEYYTRTLIKYKVIQGNCSTLTKGKIFMILKEFQSKSAGNRHPNYSEIMKTLNICVTLYHAYELLIRHGLRSFVVFFEEHLDKPLLRGNIGLRQIVEDTKAFLGPLTVSEALPDGTHTGVQENMKVGHPKFYKLQEILVQHFTKSKEATRVIVFFEYRESVKEAYALLLKNHPVIKPRIFLGQGSGVTQRVQLSVIQAFKEGTCNTLLSTSIGEEGLDVGEVDLIVCFDVSNKSPIRMIQRMGRTGRKREGRVIILVTQGKEQQTLEECLRQKKYLSMDISSSSALKSILYTNSPRMLPSDITPHCEKVYFTVKKTPTVKKNMSIKDMFRSKYGPTLDDVEEIEEVRPIIERIPPVYSYWNVANPLLVEEDETKVKFSTKIDKLRKLQPYSEVGHSKDSGILASLLHMADCKRFNIPFTQGSLPPKKNLKQGDIRTIFKQSLNTENDLKPSQALTNLSILQTQTVLENSITDETFNEIFNYLCIRETTQGTCKICTKLFKCPDIPSVSKKPDLDDWTPPNLSVLYTVTKDKFNSVMYSVSSTPILNTLSQKQNYLQPICDSSFANNNDNSFWNKLNISKLVQENENHCSENLHPSNDSFSEDESKQILSFFKLSSLEDIFANEQLKISQITTPPRNNNLILIDSSPESPTLTKPESVSELKSRIASKNLYETKFKSFTVNKNIPLKNSCLSQNLESNKKIKRVEFSRTQKEENDMRNEMNNLLDIEDVFDLSMFTEDVENQKQTTKTSEQDTNEIKSQSSPGFITKEHQSKHEESHYPSMLKSQSSYALKTKEQPSEHQQSNYPLTGCQNKSNESRAKSAKAHYLSTSKTHVELEDTLFTDDICDLSEFGLSGNNSKKRKSDDIFQNEINSKKQKVSEEPEPVNIKNRLEKGKHKYVFHHKTSPLKMNQTYRHSEDSTIDLDTEDICDLSMFGLSTQEKINEKITRKDALLDQSNTNKRKISETENEGFKKPGIPLKNQSVKTSFNHSTANGLNISKLEQSQLAITQIIDLINNAEELVENSNTSKERKNHETNSKNKDYFDDLLDKMI